LPDSGGRLVDEGGLLTGRRDHVELIFACSARPESPPADHRVIVVRAIGRIIARPPKTWWGGISCLDFVVERAV
jgi:hypothetical protein